MGMPVSSGRVSIGGDHTLGADRVVDDGWVD